MVFNVTQKKDENLEEYYENTLEELNVFFGFRWTKNRPKVWLVPDRETINSLMGGETPRWIVGWGGAQAGGVYVLDEANFEKESDNEYSPEKWRALIKHELAHCYMDVSTGTQRKPKWLSEGVATYISGQNQWKKNVDKFEGFLGCYEEGGQYAYTEGGFVVEVLINKFGKEKMLELFLIMKEERPSEEEFKGLFKRIYGIELQYNELNRLL
jgi:predicted SprT family Zn-dependent metalloprotease